MSTIREINQAIEQLDVREQIRLLQDLPVHLKIQPDDVAWELGINTDIRPRIHHNSAGKQNLFQKLSLCAITVGFVSAIKRPVNGKGVFVSLVSGPTKNGSYRHQRRVRVSVKKDAHRRGK